MDKLFYWSKKLHIVIAVSFTLISVVSMIGIGMIFYSTYVRNSEKQVMANTSQLVNQVELNLSNYIRDMMRISDSLYYSVVKDSDLTQESIDDEMSLLYEANRDNLVSLACFDEDGVMLAATPVDTLKKDAQVRTKEWFMKASHKVENLHFSSSHVQNLFVSSNNRYYWVISLSRGIELTKNGKTSQGVLLVDMNFSSIDQLFTKVNANELGYMYLVDQDGEIIYHPKQNLIYSNLYNENNEAVAAYEDGQIEEVFQGEERIITVKTVGYTGWKIVSVLPKANLYRTWNHANVIWITVLSIGVLLLIFMNRFLSDIITDPLRRLENSVKEIELENPDAIYIGGSEEVQHLGKTIRNMVKQMHQLMDDIVKEQEQKRKNELDALQSQINPHFLYNTLDSIIWMVESERYPEAIKMVTALANLFRISLSQGRTIITIEEEFAHAQNYVNIQKVRFKNKFEATFLLDERIKKENTIKLIIQPLIENAIYYGLEAMDEDGEILVSGQVRDGDIYIDVVDNGIGMPPEQVEHLLTDGNYERKRGSGIGLKNVNERIKLYFGEAYGLLVRSEPDVGTQITIHLPLKKEFLEDEV